MNNKSQYLLELAKHNVSAYIANPKFRAAMVAGSVARGICDEYSDLDMSIYWDELPSEQELQLARRQNQGSERLWVSGDRSDGGFAEAYSVNGVECQFGHVTHPAKIGLEATALATDNCTSVRANNKLTLCSSGQMEVFRSGSHRMH